MKFVLIAAINMVAANPAQAHVQHHSRPGCPKLYTVAQGERTARTIYRGTRHVTMRDYHKLGRMETCQKFKRRDQPRLRGIDRRLRGEHDARVSAASTAASYSSSDLADVPGVPRSFAACVALRESTDGRLSSNIYGMLQYHGESLAEQKREFSEMYAARGVEPWRPYDGC